MGEGHKHDAAAEGVPEAESIDFDLYKREMTPAERLLYSADCGSWKRCFRICWLGPSGRPKATTRGIELAQLRALHVGGDNPALPLITLILGVLILIWIWTLLGTASEKAEMAISSRRTLKPEDKERPLVIPVATRQESPCGRSNAARPAAPTTTESKTTKGLLDRWNGDLFDGSLAVAFFPSQVLSVF